MSADSDMPGSHAANQSKTESMPPTRGHADPDAAPDPVSVELPELASMSASVNDAQAPSHPDAGELADRGAAGVPALDTHVQSEAEPADQAATAHKAPGSLGQTGTDEQIETDVEASARSTNVVGTPGTASGPGDGHGVPVTADDAAPGTSQDSAVAQGSRTPE